MDNNLPELRDIHLPDDVSAFPPAYGWWVLIGGALIIFALLEAILFFRKKSKKLYALRLINRIQEHNVVVSALQMSEILRRICVYKYKNAATLFGKEWIDFLNSHSKYKLEGKAAGLLVDAPYIAQNTQTYTAENAETLKNFCKNWIGENL